MYQPNSYIVIFVIVAVLGCCLYYLKLRKPQQKITTKDINNDKVFTYKLIDIDPNREYFQIALPESSFLDKLIGFDMPVGGALQILIDQQNGEYDNTCYFPQGLSQISDEWQKQIALRSNENRGILLTVLLDRTTETPSNIFGVFRT